MNDANDPPVIVFRSRRRKDCLDGILVLDAAGIAYAVERDSGEYVVVVAAKDGVRSRDELDAYIREDREWSRDSALVEERGGGWSGVAVYVAIVCVVFTLERSGAFGVDWSAAGLSEAGLVRRGQLWRAVTALTLHADVRHLVGNVLFGGLIGLFAGRSFGSGIAWLSILAGGTAGNLLNAWMKPDDHASVGASTAVFAALGLIASYAWRSQREPMVSMAWRWRPLIGGLALLGFLGTAGENTDVGAHLTGFVSGVMLGALHAAVGGPVRFGRRRQMLAGATALIALTLGWVAAVGAP